jgi:hypothetical protein
MNFTRDGTLLQTLVAGPRSPARRKVSIMAANLKNDSTTDLTPDFSALFAGRLILPQSIGELSHTYRGAKPFPCLVMDNLFAPELLEPLPAEMTRLRNENWVRI